MRRMRHMFLILALWLACLPGSANASVWVECMFAADVKNITNEGDTNSFKGSMELEVQIVTVRRGTNNQDGCGFRRGETITIHNQSTSPGERRTFIAKTYDLTKLKRGDRVTVLYGLLNNDSGKQEIWDFLRVKHLK